MELQISVSQWVRPKKERERVAQLEGGLRVIRTLGNSRSSTDPSYFLMKGPKQLGHAVLTTTGILAPTRWIDVVFLATEYRGRGMMQQLLRVIVTDVKPRPLLIDAHTSNLKTYLAVGFLKMDRSQLRKWKPALDEHRQGFHYDRPIEQYVPLILER